MQNMEGCLFTSGNYTKQMSLNLKPMGFFLGGERIHFMQGWTATTRYGIARKRNTKDLGIQEISLERIYS